MLHVSRYRLSAAQVEKLSQRLVTAALLTRDRAGLTSFFDSVLTATEKVMLGKRLLIASLLHQGLSYAEISRALGVGEATIAGVGNRWQRDNKHVQSILDQLNKEEKLRETLSDIQRGLHNFTRQLPRYAGRRRWRFLNPSN